jgi:hypothetical protein
MCNKYDNERRKAEQRGIGCAGYIAHPSEYLGNGDAMSLKIGYYAGQS